MKKIQIKNKKITFLAVFIILGVMMISVGYASFSTNLMVSNAIAEIRLDKNVRVTGVTVSNTNNGGTSNDLDYNVNYISSNVLMPNSDSTITYEVEVKNFGNVEMGIKAINLPSSLENIFDVSVSNYKLGDKIRDNNNECEGTVDGCTLAIKRKIYVTLSYKNGVYNSSQTSFNNMMMYFDFQETHRITFTGFGNYFTPEIWETSIVDGLTYTKNIETYRSVTVKMGGVIVNNWSIDSNNVITIPNVTDDVEIIKEVDRYKFNIYTNPSDAYITYTVYGEERTVQGALIDEFIEGTNIELTVHKDHWKTVTKSYTTSAVDYSETINLDRLYDFEITSVEPTNANFVWKVNDVTQEAATNKISGSYVSGTRISATVSANNYETKTFNWTIGSSNIKDTVSLTHLWTMNVVVKSLGSNLSDAAITYKVNNGASQSAQGSFSVTNISGTTVDVTVKKSGYVEQTQTFTIGNSNETKEIELVPLYTYTVKTNDNYGTYLYDSTITLTASNGQTSSGSGTVSITVPRGTKVSWVAKRSYYNQQTGESVQLTGNLDNTVTLQIKTATATITANGWSDRLGTGTKDKTRSVTLSNSNSKIISVKVTGNLDNGVGWPGISTETYTASNQRLTYKYESGTGERDMTSSYEETNIYNMYTTGSVTMKWHKDTSTLVTTPKNLKATITYAIP